MVYGVGNGFLKITVLNMHKYYVNYFVLYITRTEILVNSKFKRAEDTAVRAV